MPRKKTYDSISDVLTSAEALRNKIASLPAEVREGTKELALTIICLHAKKRGPPPGKLVRPGRRGRPPGRPRKVGRPPKATPPTI